MIYTGSTIGRSLYNMLLLSLSLITLFGLLLPSDGSFYRDVIRKNQSLNIDLLAKAVTIDEYRKSMNEKGLQLPNLDGGSSSRRRLDDNGDDNYNYYYNYNNNNDDDDGQAQNNDDQQQAENEDDYYVNEENYLNFDGYSLKYAKCQPVQRFSQNAVEAGEYSPMVINDIVVMRLCTSTSCSDSTSYGCNSDFVEYAIELTDYIRIMLRYKMDKKEQLCDWCDNCADSQQGENDDYNRRRTDGGNDDDANNAADDYVADEGAYDDNANNAVDDYVADEDAYNCDDYETYCLNEYGNSICDENDDDGGNDGDDYNNNNYLSSNEYLDIIDCTQLDGGYFIRPRCDAYTETLSMGIYHDRFCSNFAGDTVNIEYFDLGIDQSYFQEFGVNAGCLDCSESDVPPYLNSNANLCNRIDVESSRCTSITTSELFVSNDTDSSYDQTDCSFIESIRSGTYDVDGQLYVNTVFGVSTRKITDTQKWLLVVSVAICFLLATYSCYLHHAITNLLIKSLSHTDLLPPSRFHRRRSSSGNRRRGRRSRKPVKDDEEEEENLEVKRDGSLV
mmetsp:Transcript_34777/g.37644  ORF Transcript_34777/g.37644 Transcript_34777/m.37644 type:complete len:560 (-) Transcript_34777:14-1693(-)